MRLPKIEIDVKTVAAALAIIQATAWTIMSLICIILYNSGLTFTSSPTTYMESLGRAIYVIFLDSQPTVDGDASFLATIFDRTFTPDVFAGFMWIYFLIDIAWIAVTVYILRKSTAFAVKLWSYCTLFVCFWDFLTFVILGADYDKCLYVGSMDKWEYDIAMTIQELCSNIILTVFFIAAKGFVLWIVNIVLALFLLLKYKQTTI